MPWEPRDNSGSLFVNDKKEKENHPDSKGSCIVGGREYWVSAWRKQGQSGTKFLSLAFTPKDEQPPESKPAATEKDDDSIPF